MCDCSPCCYGSIVLLTLIGRIFHASLLFKLTRASVSGDLLWNRANLQSCCCKTIPQPGFWSGGWQASGYPTVRNQIQNVNRFHSCCARWLLLTFVLLNQSVASYSTRCNRGLFSHLCVASERCLFSTRWFQLLNQNPKDNYWKKPWLRNNMENGFYVCTFGRFVPVLQPTHAHSWPARPLNSFRLLYSAAANCYCCICADVGVGCFDPLQTCSRSVLLEY